jgi:hypothetical protein
MQVTLHPQLAPHKLRLKRLSLRLKELKPLQNKLRQMLKLQNKPL